MNLSDIHLLYEFNYWAKARMLGAVDALSEELLYKDLKTSFGTLHGTLVHICAAEDVWLQRLTGTASPKFLTVADLPDYSAVKTKWQEVEKGMLTYVHSLTRRTTSANIHLLKHQRRTGEQRAMAGAPASRQPWHIPPRANHFDDSAARRNAGEHRPHRILPAKKVMTGKKKIPSSIARRDFCLQQHYCSLCYIRFFLFFFLRFFFFAVLVRIDKLQLFRFLVELHLDLAAVAEFSFQNFF